MEKKEVIVCLFSFSTMDASMLALLLEASDDSGFAAIEHLGTFSDGSSESIVQSSPVAVPTVQKNYSIIVLRVFFGMTYHGTTTQHSKRTLEWNGPLSRYKMRQYIKRGKNH